MFNNFSEEARKTIILAKEEMNLLKHPYVSSEHLLLSILKTNNNVSNRLKKYDLTYERFKNEIIDVIGVGKKESEWVLYTPMLKKILEKAIMISIDLNEDVKIEHLFQALLDEGEGIAIRLLLKMNIDYDSLYNEFVSKGIKKNKRRKSMLDDIGKDMVKNSFNNDPVIGRENEIKRVIEILLRRTKNNPLLIGEAGVGKTAIVEELARMIASGEVPQKLQNKRIINLDMSSLVAGTKYRGEFEEKINKLIREVEENDEIILFIDEIHTLVGAGGAEGAIDAANILKPALARNKIRIIGATTTKEYKKFIENDKALERRFQTVIIEEPNEKVVKNIINSLKPIYEEYHKVIIKDDIIDKLILLTKKYIKTRKDPDRTIDVLDEVCSHSNLKENKSFKLYNNLTKELKIITKLKKEAIINDDLNMAFNYKNEEKDILSRLNILELELLNQKKNEVTVKDIEDVLINKIKVPKCCFQKTNQNKIINQLKKKILCQDNALKELVNSFTNNLQNDDCQVFLLAGTSGVGKTETCLEFAKIFNYNILRLDMSEYSEPHTISKLIGSPAGYVGYEEAALLDKINLNPFTVIVLDEIERCHESILNLFFQIMDNNKLKNAKGEDIYFNNAIILMTTNIQNNIIGFNKEGKNEYFNFFSKPFMNRINKVIEFRTFDREDIIKILINKYKKDKLSSEEINEILIKSDYQNYGARQIPYIIKDLHIDKRIMSKNNKKVKKKIVNV